MGALHCISLIFIKFLLHSWVISLPGAHILYLLADVPSAKAGHFADCIHHKSVTKLLAKAVRHHFEHIWHNDKSAQNRAGLRKQIAYCN